MTMPRRPKILEYWRAWAIEPQSSRNCSKVSVRAASSSSPASEASRRSTRRSNESSSPSAAATATIHASSWSSQAERLRRSAGVVLPSGGRRGSASSMIRSTGWRDPKSSRSPGSPTGSSGAVDTELWSATLGG